MIKFIVNYTCPTCGKDHKRELRLMNGNNEINIEELACDKSFYCECGTTFASPPYNELYIEI